MNNTEAYLVWFHERKPLYDLSYPENKFLWLGDCATRGFLFTESLDVYNQIKPEEIHSWRSLGQVPQDCREVTNEIIRSILTESVIQDESPFDMDFIVRTIKSSL